MKKPFKYNKLSLFFSRKAGKEARQEKHKKQRRKNKERKITRREEIKKKKKRTEIYKIKLKIGKLKQNRLGTQFLKKNIFTKLPDNWAKTDTKQTKMIAECAKIA